MSRSDKRSAADNTRKSLKDTAYLSKLRYDINANAPNTQDVLANALEKQASTIDRRSDSGALIGGFTEGLGTGLRMSSVNQKKEAQEGILKTLDYLDYQNKKLLKQNEWNMEQEQKNAIIENSAFSLAQFVYGSPVEPDAKSVKEFGQLVFQDMLKSGAVPENTEYLGPSTTPGTKTIIMLKYPDGSVHAENVLNILNSDQRAQIKDLVSMSLHKRQLDQQMQQQNAQIALGRDKLGLLREQSRSEMQGQRLKNEELGLKLEEAYEGRERQNRIRDELEDREHFMEEGTNDYISIPLTDELKKEYAPKVAEADTIIKKSEKTKKIIGDMKQIFDLYPNINASFIKALSDNPSSPTFFQTLANKFTDNSEERKAIEILKKNADQLVLNQVGELKGQGHTTDMMLGMMKNASPNGSLSVDSFNYLAEDLLKQSDENIEDNLKLFSDYGKGILTTRRRAKTPTSGSYFNKKSDSQKKIYKDPETGKEHSLTDSEIKELRELGHKI